MRGSIAGVVALLALLLVGTRGASAADTIRGYTSITTEPEAKLEAKLRSNFPKVDFEWVRGGGVGIFQRFVSERAAGKGKIDIVHFAYTPGWYYLAHQHWVMPGIAALGEAAKYPDWAKSSKAHFVALRIPTLRVVYNANKVKPEDLPKSWHDFETAKWRGRLALSDPLQAAGVWDFFYGSKEFGPDYVVKLLKNDVLISGQMGSALDAVARGERDVTFVFDYIALTRMATTPNLKFAMMKEGVPVIPAPIGIVADTTHPELAKKVLDFLLSKEGQMVIVKDVKTYSALPGMPPPPGLEPLDKLKLIFSDFEKVYHEQNQYRQLIMRNLPRR